MKDLVAPGHRPETLGFPMESIKSLYRIGKGPSSSHTMGPSSAATAFSAENPDAASFRATFYGSLAATGKGHLSDKAVEESFAPKRTEIFWKPDQVMEFHPNAMDLEACSGEGKIISSARFYSVGGGRILREGCPPDARSANVYHINSMQQLLAEVDNEGIPLWKYVEKCEGGDIWNFLGEVWRTMSACIERGISSEGVLPGVLRLERKARQFNMKSRMQGRDFQRTGLISSYALAVAEENASGGMVVTAPTCGSCGVLPAVLRYLKEYAGMMDLEILHALATASVFGNVVKTNASISGAEVGCQGEIGTACAMAAAAAAQILGGTSRQIEYAAEIALEHHLGLTCDPVAGLVQIPCIERNAFAATRALGCAEYALLTDGKHKIGFDEVVETMRQTGHDMKSSYRETARGGLAKVYEGR